MQQHCIRFFQRLLAKRHYEEDEEGMTLDGKYEEKINSCAEINNSCDILRRIGIASSAMHSMQRVWRQRILSLSTKL